MEMMRVSSMSQPSKVAGALTSLLREEKNVQIQVIGAAALNQAMKAIAIACICPYKSVSFSQYMAISPRRMASSTPMMPK